MDRLSKPVKLSNFTKHIRLNSSKNLAVNKSSLLKRGLKLGLPALVMLYLVCAIALPFYICTVQNRSASSGYTPADFGLNFSEVSFPTTEDKTTIRGWYIPGTNGRAILGVHGKDGNRTALIEKSAYLARQGYTLLLIDMRGHGTSDGQWHSLGYYEQRDVLGAVAYLKQRGFSGSQVGILSESLGAVVSLIVMSQTDVKTVVADSPFARLSTILEDVNAGTALAPLLPGMLVSSSLLRGIDVNQVVPENAVKNIKGRQVMLIAGKLDTLIPVKHHYSLKSALGYAAINSWLVPDAGHIEAFSLHPDEYRARVAYFFDTQLEPAKLPASK